MADNIEMIGSLGIVNVAPFPAVRHSDRFGRRIAFCHRIFRKEMRWFDKNGQVDKDGQLIQN
jgi:hypothetical protein